MADRFAAFCTWVGRVLCGHLGGHEYLWTRSAHRWLMVCMNCGHESPHYQPPPADAFGHPMRPPVDHFGHPLPHGMARAASSSSVFKRGR